LKNVAIIGGGGFAKEIIEVVEILGYEVYGIFAQEEPDFQYSYKGYLNELLESRSEFSGVILAIGAFNPDTIKARSSILSFLKLHNIEQVSIISPFARIGAGVEIGKGVYVAHNSVIAVDAKIGDSVSINTGSFIGHDAIVSPNSVIGPKVFIGGGCIIEKDVTIAASSNILQGVRIGANSTVGISSLVLKSLKPNSFTLPEPSRVINRD
jgi:sugar O-acyltransferase (sialic acid O-acetyltransferase NeuD family)